MSSLHSFFNTVIKISSLNTIYCISIQGNYYIILINHTVKSKLQ